MSEYPKSLGIDIFYRIEQKGMTFDHDFGYSFPFFSSLLKKKEEKENEIEKIVIKGHAFLLDHFISKNLH